jgi:hypothetical protein
MATKRRAHRSANLMYIDRTRPFGIANELDVPATPVEIVKVGHSALRNGTRNVPQKLFGTSALHELIEVMRVTLAGNGVGLPAPLAARGNLLVRPTTAPSKYHFGEVFQSQGPAGDLDDTGPTILVTLANGRSLLPTGDADYTYVINTYRLWRRRRPRYSGQSRNAET